jgi:type IV secretory pathway VirB4 component
MLSLKKIDNGKIIGSILDTKKRLYVKDDLEDHENDVKIDNKEFYIPSFDKENFRCALIIGNSGSGKSFLAKQIANQYRADFPKKNKIILFSPFEQDKSLDDIKNLKRVHMDKFTEQYLDFEIDEFKNSLIIMDDFEAITNKFERKCIEDLIMKILCTGRHNNIHIIMIVHQIIGSSNVKLARYMMSESNFIISFPRSQFNKTSIYLYQNYLGMDKKQIEYVKKEKSRWISVTTSNPQVVLSQHNAVILNDIN